MSTIAITQQVTNQKWFDDDDGDDDEWVKCIDFKLKIDDWSNQIIINIYK